MKRKFLIVFIAALGTAAPAWAESQMAPGQMDNFSLSGFCEKGKKNWEVNGKSADIGAQVIKLNDVQSSLYGDNSTVKLTAQKGVRLVEHITVAPVVNLMQEERETVEIFTRQLTESGLYKIWPQEALTPGEYAVMEYTEGKVDGRIWDFRIP